MGCLDSFHPFLKGCQELLLGFSNRDNWECLKKNLLVLLSVAPFVARKVLRFPVCQLSQVKRTMKGKVRAIAGGQAAAPEKPLWASLESTLAITGRARSVSVPQAKRRAVQR